MGDRSRDTDASKIQVQEINGLGYENVTFPFLALVSGLCVALLTLGIETAIICKKRCSDTEEQSNEDESTSEEEEIINDIYDLLLQNRCQLGGIKFLSKMRTQLTLPDACPLKVITRDQ